MQTLHEDVVVVVVGPEKQNKILKAGLKLFTKTTTVILTLDNEQTNRSQ